MNRNFSSITSLKIYLSLLLSLLLTSYSLAQEACNAHIELPQEDSTLSFDKMYLEVYTLQSGSKIESSQCTPDGNCFIVVYNLDAFSLRLKGPLGSVFEPSEYKIDSTHRCEDLVFKLKGFSLNLDVKIKSQEQNQHHQQLASGPAGIQIELKKGKGQSSKLLSTKATNGEGQVIFDNIASADTYTAKIISNTDITFDSQEVSCDFKWDSGFTCDKPHFLITGFTIKGSVLSYNEPMPNVNVYLYHGHHQIQEKDKSFLAQKTTDSSGQYSFENVVPGVYQVKAVYTENQSKFSVEPSSIKVNVENHSETVSAFSVIGFSIFGRVVNQKGEGIPGVKILIDGQQRALTNDKGTYKLDEITPGAYILEGVSQHYIFDALSVNIQPQSRQIQNLVALFYHLCGKISIDASSGDNKFSLSKRSVILTEKSKGERRSYSDESGEFCFEVKPGSYLVTPVVTNEEREKGLKLNPSERTVIVDGAPVLNVNFAQTKLSISGNIKCLEEEDSKCSTLKVLLMKQGKVVETEQNNQGQFKFEKILPGKYVLKLSADDFCWQQEKFDVDISDNDLKDINFIQTGYSMPYESSNAFNVKIKKGKSTTLDTKIILEGKNNKLCLDQRGSYSIIPDSCYKFGQEKFEFNTSASERQVLQFKPTHYQVDGKVILKEKEQANKIKMTIKEKNKEESEEIIVQLIKQTDNEYTFEYYSLANKHLVVEPVLQDEGNLLFYPQKNDVKIHEECVHDIKFEAKSGLILSGMIDPPTADVEIKVTNSKTQEEVAILMTDAHGKYKVGPLYDDQVYEIEATKEDYIFKKEGNNFKAQKLSSLIIQVKDQEDKPLDSVFLSLSAGKGQRKTGTTNLKGQFKFVGLNSGKFYITAILKEYEFDQSSFAIDLKDGEHTTKVLVAKRVAYSAFGSVTKINGLPLESARVSAQCQDCDKVEETQVDSDGNYRLRGLIPGHKYKLQVYSEQIERTVPNFLLIDVITEDSKGHEFLAIMQSPYIEISGSVDFQGEDQSLVFREDPKTTIELYDAEHLESPIQQVSLSLSRYFQFSFLQRREYILRVVPKRGANDRRYESVTFRVNETGGFQKLVVPKSSKKQGDIKRSDLLGPVLVGIGIFLFFYYDQITQWFGSKSEVASSSGKPSSEKRAGKQKKN